MLEHRLNRRKIPALQGGGNLGPSCYAGNRRRTIERAALTQMTGLDPFDLVMPPMVALAVLVLGYAQCRRIRHGQPLSSFQQKLLFYGTVFTLGMCYAMSLHVRLAALVH